MLHVRNPKGLRLGADAVYEVVVRDGSGGDRALNFGVVREGDGLGDGVDGVRFGFNGGDEAFFVSGHIADGLQDGFGGVGGDGGEEGVDNENV